jgi:hypothetical protein
VGIHTALPRHKNAVLIFNSRMRDSRGQAVDSQRCTLVALYLSMRQSPIIVGRGRDYEQKNISHLEK